MGGSRAGTAFHHFHHVSQGTAAFPPLVALLRVGLALGALSSLAATECALQSRQSARADPCKGFKCPGNKKCFYSAGQGRVCRCPPGKRLSLKSNTLCERRPAGPCGTKYCVGQLLCSVQGRTAVCGCPQGKKVNAGDTTECVSKKQVVPCEGIKCKANEQCLTLGQDPKTDKFKLKCVCKRGFTKRGKKCTKKNPCKGVSCPANQQCLAARGQAKCQCQPGFVKQASTCTKSSTNSAANVAEATWKRSCPEGSSLQVYNGIPLCACNDMESHWADGSCTLGPLEHSDYLDPHNSARAYLGAASIRWSDAVAASAQRWADHLGRTEGCQLGTVDPSVPFSPTSRAEGYSGAPGVYREDPTYPYGQNVAWGTIEWTNGDAVMQWIAEAAHQWHAGSAEECIAGNSVACAQYSQVVQTGIRSVGCGTSSCEGGVAVWVCEYEKLINSTGAAN